MEEERTEMTEQTEVNTPQETPTEKTEAPETAPAENSEETPVDTTEFDGINNAKKQLETLKGFNQEQTVDDNQFTYDEDLEQWVDKNGKLYDTKPETGQTVNQFDPYNWQLGQAEANIQKAKENLVASKEREAIDMFEKGFADLKDSLSQASWEVLKHDVVAPAMQEFANAIYSDKYDENTLKAVVDNIQNGIEARKSIYNLRGQAQENINTQKNTKYPLEGQAPTGVQGEINTKTFRGKSRQEISGILNNLKNKFNL
jgi:hypothetical protein